MFYVYILYSPSKGRYYIGQTNQVRKRLDRHNKGEVRSTKHGIPWELKYTEEYETRSESVQRENYLKRLKSRIKIEELIRAKG